MNLLWSVAKQAGWSSTEITRAAVSKGHHLPRIDFIAEADNCAVCQAPLEVVRTKNRTVWGSQGIAGTSKLRGGEPDLKQSHAIS